jgi:hypothetical protein
MATFGRSMQRNWKERYNWDIMESRLLDAYKDIGNRKASDRRRF